MLLRLVIGFSGTRKAALREYAITASLGCQPKFLIL